MYTRVDFGRALKEKVYHRENVVFIGEWAHTMYMEHIEDIEDIEKEILLCQKELNVFRSVDEKKEMIKI